MIFDIWDLIKRIVKAVWRKCFHPIVVWAWKKVKHVLAVIQDYLDSIRSHDERPAEYVPAPEEEAKNAAFVEQREAEGTQIYIRRHSRLARFTHGTLAICCGLLIVSGLFTFIGPLSRLVGPDAVFVMRMSHRVVGCIFILVPIISAIRAPMGAWHMFKEDFFTKWDKDDNKWMILFIPYLFLAKHLHMPDQSDNKSGQRFADGLLILDSILMAVSGIVLWLGSSVFTLGATAHSVFLLLHDIGFFLICIFGMAHVFLGSGIFQPYRGSANLMWGDGTVSESDALYHWGHWARKEIEKGENIVRK